jgi:biopolymer transport protein TolR
MRLFVREPTWTTRKKRTPLRSVIDVSGFAGVMLALLFLMMFGEMYPMHPKSLPVDMAIIRHSSSLPNAQREDAVIVTITRDGSLYLLNTRVTPADVPPQLRDLMGSREDKTVYVKADARAKYGDVKVALDAIRSANVKNIAFLTESARAVSTP